MPVLINDVVSEFEPQSRAPSATSQQEPDAGSATSALEQAEIAEFLALQRARQQRLEVD